MESVSIIVSFIGRAFMLLLLLYVFGWWVINMAQYLVAFIREYKAAEQAKKALAAQRTKELIKARYDAEKQQQQSYIDCIGNVDIEKAKEIIRIQSTYDPRKIELEIK